MTKPVHLSRPCCATLGVATRPGKRNSLLVACLLLACQGLFAQRGGERIYEFIHLPISARATALGGSQIAAPVNDYGLSGGNPAMLNASMDKTLLFQHNFHFDGIANGFAGYAKQINKWNATVHGGIHYLSYGKFTAADDRGNITGEFKANDLAIQLGMAKQLNERISAGVQLNYIQSSLETYTSNGLLLDLGLTYASEDGLNHYAFVLKGSGLQFTTYYEGDERGRMPVDLQFGISKRLAHVPFRLSVLAHSLNRWDLRYDSPLDEETTIGFGEEEPREPSKFGQDVDNVFRHLVFGGEFLIGKNEGIMLRLGYHHQRRKELSVVGLRSLAGFSGGVGLNFRSFVLDYGFAVYHQAGSSKHLGVRVQLGQLREKSIVD
jgi:hypothetical protein